MDAMGLTPQALANRSGVGVLTIEKILEGKTQGPHRVPLENLAWALNASVRWLYVGFHPWEDAGEMMKGEGGNEDA